MSPINQSPVSLVEALVIVDQLSPMPAIAHQALLTLRAELQPHLDYELFVADNWQHRRHSDRTRVVAREERTAEHEALRQNYIMSTGLAGETGEVLELLKKDVRDGSLDVRELAMELGDALHYLTKIAHHHGLTLSDLKRINQAKLLARRTGGKGAFTAADVVLGAAR